MLNFEVASTYKLSVEVKAHLSEIWTSLLQIVIGNDYLAIMLSFRSIDEMLKCVAYIWSVAFSKDNPFSFCEQ